MRITAFAQAPYRFMPDDFEQHHNSVCDTPYSLANRDGVYASIKDFMDELLHAARAGLDGITLTEHGQSSYDMMPNPDLVASALAYATELEGLDVAIYPMGRSLGKTREPIRVAEEYAMLDVISGGRLVAGIPVGLGYDAAINNGVPPIQIRTRFDENLELVLRAWRDQEPFAFNGRHSQYPMVNLWPRPLQDNVPVFITGIGNPRTMQLTLERGFGFNYFSFGGANLTARRIFPRYWEIADSLGVPRNPFRVGFLQTIGVAATDAEAERIYAGPAEYAFRKGLGSIPSEKLLIPGGLDIRGLQALLSDPADFGMTAQMKNATFKELSDAGAVIVGSPATVRDRLTEFCKEHGIGNLHAMLSFGNLSRQDAFANIEMFASEVAPALRGLWDGSGFAHHWWPERLGGQPQAHTPAAERVTP
ncbi:LLM class flavin-dependent oxidoreductase [Longispora albida]|uniref:LLM class flavin-dependent oxidoreductase n=1 Tax=Longispora albida TaxID=203523 RepID=UPI0003687BB9|nr:LLM class flavin-dependent oxidoreductase [Longispora albida]